MIGSVSSALGGDVFIKLFVELPVCIELGGFFRVLDTTIGSLSDSEGVSSLEVSEVCLACMVTGLPRKELTTCIGSPSLLSSEAGVLRRDEPVDAFILLCEAGEQKVISGVSLESEEAEVDVCILLGARDLLIAGRREEPGSESIGCFASASLSNARLFPLAIARDTETDFGGSQVLLTIMGSETSTCELEESVDVSTIRGRLCFVFFADTLDDVLLALDVVLGLLAMGLCEVVGRVMDARTRGTSSAEAEEVSSALAKVFLRKKTVCALLCGTLAT